MTISSVRRGLLAASLFCLAAPASHAQSLGLGGPGGHKDSSDSEPKKVAPPAAIPGAQANQDEVVPASKAAKDLDPNAALFDAIDRGDLTAAREALNRGADLNARNVLGQRPIDMSIDLSRNAITFLLLSMRAEDGDPNAQQANAGDGDAREAAAPSPVAETHGRRHHRVAPVLVATAQKPPSAASTSDVAPMQPSAGFLGFGH
jgi:hypothetical protein